MTDRFSVGLREPQNLALILRRNAGAAGIASKDGRTLWGSCFEAPLRGAPQHEGKGVRASLCNI